jgi:DNA-binding MarR family transcriptional regulator
MSINQPGPAPHDVRDRCLCFGAQRAARVLGRRFDAAFRRLNLTNNQFSLLYALSRSGAVRLSEMAAMLGADRTTLTAALKPLVRRGLLVSTPDMVDRRSRRLSLTPEGERLLATALPVWRTCHEDLESEIGRKVVDGLRTGFDVLAARA